MKYCPKCVRECSISPYGGYACEHCEVLQFATGILLDKPDEQASREFKLRELLRSCVSYEVNEYQLEDLIVKLKELIAPPIKNIDN